MAMTHDYLDYLNENVGIAPANSQEELQAAQTIAGLMAQHDVEPKIEEFDAPAIAGLTGAVLSIVLFVAVVISGIGMMALTLVGLVLAAIPTALAVLSALGRPVPLAFGPSARSQNVVACHRATGPMVTKGNRTIVVVAHYDSPHENFLYSSPAAPYLPLVAKAAHWCVFAVAVCVLIQLLGFVPEAARRIFWIIGILASLPGLLLAVGTIAERMAPCTLGANDNKSSVAALLGVLENVRPSGVAPQPRPVAQEEPAPEPAAGEAESAPESVVAAEPAGAPEPAPVMEEVLGVRRGEDVLRSLGILPEDCEIEYVEPAVVTPAPAVMVPSASETAPIETPTDAADVTAATTGDLGATREQLLSTGQFSLVMDEGERSIGPKDSSGLTNTEQLDADLDATRPAPPVERPKAPSDPEWGKASFRPQLSDVARRASLFDLPDPSATGVDPFGAEDGATRVQPAKQVPTVRAPQPAPAPQPSAAPVQNSGSAAVSAPEPISTIGSSNDEAKEKKFGGVGGFFDRLKKKHLSHQDASKDTPSSDSWLGDDAEDDSDGLWRGGAATRSGLRLVGEDEVAEAPSEDELREAVLKLGDDALISHDIWFVALGASSLDHAGMRAFLSQHRSDVRGCFVVNLDCVGAGNLSVVTREGLEGTRRADRRLGRLLSNAAGDLHTSLAQHTMDWTETDATPAMRSSMRSVTIMGVGENGLPALSRTAADAPEAVDGDQASKVTQIVTEMIRRS